MAAETPTKKKRATSFVDAIEEIEVYGEDRSLIDKEETKTTAKTVQKYIRKTVEPSEIMANPINEFSMERDEEWELLSSSIKETGITNDIIVYENPDSSSTQKYIALSGHRRLQIAIELNEERVPIKIRPPFEDKSEELLFIFIENKSTRKQKPLDIALSIKSLEEELIKESKETGEELVGRKRDYIAEKLNMSSTAVYEYLSLANLPKQAQLWLSNEYIGLKQGVALSKLTPPQLEIITKKVKMAEIDGKATKEQMQNLIKVLMAKTTKKQKAPSGELTSRKLTSNINKTLKKTISDLAPIAGISLTITDENKNKLLGQVDETIEVLNKLKTNLANS